MARWGKRRGENNLAMERVMWSGITGLELRLAEVWKRIAKGFPVKYQPVIVMIQYNMVYSIDPECHGFGSFMHARHLLLVIVPDHPQTHSAGTSFWAQNGNERPNRVYQQDDVEADLNSCVTL